VTLRQRQPRVEDPDFLDFLRGRRCCSCGAPPRVQAAHLRAACPDRGKRETGMQEKPDDRWAVPLCSSCHLDGPQALHRVGEERFFSRLAIDPFGLAERLYGEFSAGRPPVNPRLTRPPRNRPRPAPGVARTWPKRPLRSASRWPPSGARPFNRRKDR